MASMEDMLKSAGMTVREIEQALSMGTAAFEANSPQAQTVAEVLGLLMAAENASNLVQSVGVSGANS